MNTPPEALAVLRATLTMIALYTIVASCVLMLFRPHTEDRLLRLSVLYAGGLIALAIVLGQARP